MILLLLPVLLVALGLSFVVTRSGRSVTDTAWLDGGGHAEFVAPVGPPVARVVASPRRAAVALAGVEAKAWLSSPWFAVGISLCLLQIVLFGWVWAGEDVSSWPAFVVLYPVMAFPLTGMAVVGAHFAVTRSRRDRSEEIFAACPADETTRTAAHVLSGWVPAAVLAAFVVVLTLVVPINDTHLYGFRGLLVGDALAAIVLGWCGVALGVALARWAPFALVPVVALPVLLVAIVNVGNLGEPHWSNLRQLSPWPRYPDHDLVFTSRHVWSHLAWLIALGGLMAVIAFVHHRRDRRMLVVAGAVVACVFVTGAITTRPISDGEAARIASLVVDPAAHQTCRTTGTVSVCAYRGYEEYVDQVVAQVRPVAAAVATVTGGTATRVALHQHFEGNLSVLGPEVTAAMRGRPTGHPGIPLGYETGRASMHRARLVVAASAVGLPASPHNRRPYVAVGQARGVIALWLAAQGLPPKDQASLATYHVDPFEYEAREPTAFDLGSAWPQTCDGEAPAVVWSDADLIAARRLVARPAAAVAEVVRAQWRRFVDPRATTNELLAALGLGSVPIPEPFDARPFPC